MSQEAFLTNLCQGYEYGRSGNPNRDALETLLSSIEAGGSECITFSSGSAATATMLQSLGANAHIISMNCVYGGTFRYMTRVAGETQGLETTFMDLERASEEDVLANIKENTKVSHAVSAETHHLISPLSVDLD